MSVTDEIKSRLDIVEFIGQYVSLRKRGRYYVAPCPFHTERTPSFVVYPETQGWHCFGACSTGGDIFNFLMRHENMDFATALRFLAEKAGVELHERSDAQRAADQHIERLRGMLGQAADYYHDMLLKSREAAAARAYVRKRGLGDEIVKAFRIGYAPPGWDTGLSELIRLGKYSHDELIEAGCAIRNDSGRVYDRFRNRLMIPICDERGRPIGFGARALDPEDNPKYLNSPQTPLFDKSAVLFGLNLARPAIREQEVAVIVEGYMDAIQAHQAGFTNVVAQMGTALTRPQLKQLSTYARRLILALDSDAAGIKATMRGLHVIAEASEQRAILDIRSDRGKRETREALREASRFDLDIQVITVPGAKDPDELIREDPESWRMLVVNAQPVADYLITTATAGLDKNATLAEREQVARELLPILTATESDFQRNDNAQRLAYALRLGSGQAMLNWMEKHAPGKEEVVKYPTSSSPALPVSTTAPAPPDAPPAERAAMAAARQGILAGANPALERHCLANLVQFDTLLSASRRVLREVAQIAPKAAGVLGPLEASDFTDSAYRAIFLELEKAHRQYDLDPRDYLRKHLPADLQEVLENLLAHVPLDNFEAGVGRVLGADLKTARDKIQRNVQRTLIEKKAKETFDLQVLNLRALRLKRESVDLQYLQQDANEEEFRVYSPRMVSNTLALDALTKAMKLLRGRTGL